MGFKKTSELIAISFEVQEPAPNVFVQDEIALQLDVLNNEIFVVLGVDIDLALPDALAATDTSTRASITSTSAATIQDIGTTNCIASARDSIRAAGFVDGGVAFNRAAETTYSNIDYVALIATNNFFVQLVGQNNGAAKSLAGRVWGYRAKADSSTYAALVQSEVLSA